MQAVFVWKKRQIGGTTFCSYTKQMRFIKEKKMKAFDNAHRGTGAEKNTVFSFGKIFKRAASLALVLALCLSLSACGQTAPAAENKAEETPNIGKVVIYTPTEDYLIEYLQERLDKAFPNTEISIEYYHSREVASKILAEGTDTECDIVFDIEYGYLQSLKDILTPIDFIDEAQFTSDMISADKTYFPVDRYSGAVIIRPDLLKEAGLPVPESYEDLLKPEYKGLIEMPDPGASSTGYLFLKSLVNAWGEDEAFDYFAKLDENILQYTSGGSGPVKDAVKGECSIALSLTFNAVNLINEGADLQILYFKEGAPYTPAGLSIISGKEKRSEVIDIVKYFYSDIIDDYCGTYLPEKIKNDQVNNVPNYPADIPYADMSNNTPDVKEALIERWNNR